MKALLMRDLRLATRAGGGFGLALAFFLIVCTLVPFGVGPEGGQLSRIAPGILWVGALLACLLSLDRIFALDFEDGSLDLLATSPLPLEGAVAVKAFAHWLTTGLPLVIFAPVLGVLLHLPGPAYPWLLASLAMGTPALLVEGTCSAEGVTHGLNGYLCRNSVESIARGIVEALPTAGEVGLKARETIPIPWDTLILQVLARYEALIARKAEGDCK